jgi:hypothetical protein
MNRTVKINLHADNTMVYLSSSDKYTVLEDILTT